MAERLLDKVCVITGTGGTIGRAAALAFAREGALVVGSDINAKAAEETLAIVRAAGGKMISVHPLDLFDKAECSRLVSSAIEAHGRIDILFNNAGNFHHGWITDSDDDFWFKTINEELHIVFMLCRAAWEALSKSGGTIVNMASTAGHTTYKMLPGIAHSAAKGGVISLTRHLALEGRDRNIRANSLSPGVVGTPPVLERAKADPAWGAAMRGRMMRQQFARPEEIAAVALFLASDESSFVNAADIVVDDGLLSWG